MIMLKLMASKRRKKLLPTHTLRCRPQETKFVSSVAKLFSSTSILHHHDEKRVLYVDLDASKEFGFGAHIYHSTEESSDPPKQKSQQSIIFLSRLLTDAEIRY